MPNKPIIDIAVNDSQFRDFYRLFQQYEERLAEMPEDWKDIDQNISRAEKTMDSFSSASVTSKEFLLIAAIQADAIAKNMSHATLAVKSFGKATKESHAWLGKVEKSVSSIGKSILKMGAWGAALSGISGVLGALSFYDMASAAVSNQRSSRELGVTTGQYRAFGQDYGRFLDPSILGNIANAQNSYTGRVWLGLATGLGQGAVSNLGPDQLAARLAIRAHEWWNKTPAAQRTVENLQATGFSQSGLTISDVRFLGNTPLSELQAAQRQYGRDQRSLNINDQTTQAWYGFIRQINLAGKTIETDLTNRLVTLAPSIKSFIASFTQDADKLINSVLTPKNLDSLATGFTKLADYIGSPAFQQSLKNFADTINTLFHPVQAVEKQFTPQESKQSVLSHAWDRVRHLLSYPMAPETNLSTLEGQKNLPAGILSGIWGAESSKGKNIFGPMLKNGDQAIGDFQFTKETWKQWGKGGSRLSFMDEARAAANYLQYFLKQYRGDIKKALVAYNWGQGNLDKDIAAHGSDWLKYSPQKSQEYVKKVMDSMAKQALNLKVTVSNSTSSKVAVQANAAAF